MSRSPGLLSPFGIVNTDFQRFSTELGLKELVYVLIRLVVINVCNCTEVENYTKCARLKLYTHWHLMWHIIYTTHL